MPFVLALDQGTTSSRAILFDEHGSPLHVAQHAYRQIFPQPGWVEHDPREIWETQLACAREVIAAARLAASDIAAIGITNQRETTVIWDRASGAPIYNAIVWQDRRTNEWCEQQRERGLLLAVRSKTGLVLDPYFSASKIVWILDHVDGARQRAERGELAFGTIDSWLLWQLTGGSHATDPSNASRTLLFNIHAGQWAAELAEAFGVPTSLLATVQPSASQFGESLAHWFGQAIRICGVAGDQQSALFGQGCFGPGQVKNTYGTGCFMLMHTGDQSIMSTHGLLATAAAQTTPQVEYAIEGSVFSAGSAVQWLRDEMKLIDSAAEIEDLAASVPDSGGAMLVPAFTGLGSPYWDAEARGALLGITRGTGRAQVARAALDAIALQSAELLSAMSADASLEFKELRVDGGASANNLLMQIQADLLGVPVVRPEVSETTARGAADLAALGAGLWPDAVTLRRTREAEEKFRVFEPAASRDWAEDKLSQWRRAVARVLTTQG